MGEQVGQQIDNLARAIAPACVLQVGPLPRLGMTERRELGANEVEVAVLDLKPGDRYQVSCTARMVACSVTPL